MAATIISITQKLDQVGFYSTDDIVPADLVIDGVTTTWKTVLRVVVGEPPASEDPGVQAGDLLKVDTWFKATNDAGYNVGLGVTLWWYDLDNGLGSAGTWYRLDPESGSTGENVTPDGHHISLGLRSPFLVPEDWPAGHRIVVAVRGDAHSTAWDSDDHDGTADDRLTLDQYGVLMVDHMRVAPAV